MFYFHHIHSNGATGRNANLHATTQAHVTRRFEQRISGNGLCLCFARYDLGRYESYAPLRQQGIASIEQNLRGITFFFGTVANCAATECYFHNSGFVYFCIFFWMEARICHQLRCGWLQLELVERAVKVGPRWSVPAGSPARQGVVSGHHVVVRGRHQQNRLQVQRFARSGDANGVRHVGVVNFTFVHTALVLWLRLKPDVSRGEDER